MESAHPHLLAAWANEIDNSMTHLIRCFVGKGDRQDLHRIDP
jgi:hypothetical protein